MFPTIRPSAGGASSNSPPPAAADDAVPGPSGANANPDGFDASRAKVARVLAGGQRRGRTSAKSQELVEKAKRALKADSHEVREALGRLEEICRNKQITFCDSLYRLLAECPQENRAEFIEKTAYFFEQTTGVSSTQTITTMLGPHLQTAVRRNFLAMDHSSIQSVARCEFIQNIATMCNGKGFPDAQALRNFLACKSLNPDGQFDKELFRCIVTMRCGRGVPASHEVDALLTMPVFKTGDVFNHTLFKSITSFHSYKGFPKSQDIQSFLNIDALKTNGQINQTRINTLATLCRGKGLPTKQAVTDLFSSKHLQTDGQLSQDLLTPIVGMFSGKGIPSAKELQTLFTEPLLQKDNKICLPLLKSISSMQNRKGLPDSGKLRALLSLTALMVEGKGAKAFPLLSSVASMCNNRGLPDRAKVEELLNVSGLRTASGAINEQAFRTIAYMQHAKGLANAKVVHELLSLPQLQVGGQVNTLLLKAIGNLYACRGIPPLAEVRRLLALPGLHVNGHFNQQLLAEVATRGGSRGFPTNEIINNARIKMQQAPFEIDTEGEDGFEPQQDPASSVETQSAASQSMATESIDQPSGGDDQDWQPLPPIPADDDFELPEDLDPFAFIEPPNIEGLDSFLHDTPMTSAAADGASSSAGDQLPAFDSEFWQPFTASEPTPSTSGTSRRSAPEPSSPSLVGKRTSPLAKRRKKE